MTISRSRYDREALSTGITSIGLCPHNPDPQPCGMRTNSGAVPLNTPLKNGDDKMKEEKVRIKVRLTEEEKEKLERNSALCGLTQSEYVRQLCRGIHPKPKPPDVFWRLMEELYKAHSDLKECAKYEPSALELCAEIEQLVLDLQEVI